MAQTHTIPAGLEDNQVEFYATADLKARCMCNGSRCSVSELSRAKQDEIYQQIPDYKIAGINQMGITERVEVLEKFVVCMYADFDHKADMIDGVLQPGEFWPCPERGKCKWEFIVCDPVLTDRGEKLSGREVEVIALTAEGELDKSIASRLNISQHTVTSHARNIRNKTGLMRKADITRFAIQKNIIS